MGTWVDDLPQDKVENWIDTYGNQAMEIHHTNDARFALWLHTMDSQVQRMTMMSYQDMEDWDYISAYEGGMPPGGAAVEMLADLGWL